MQRFRIGITEKNQGEYWGLVNAGWHDAADRLGLDLQFAAPKSEDVDAQRALMRVQLADGVDALAFVATRANAFSDIVAEAAASGIPSISFDLDAPDSGRIYFVGMDTPIEVGRQLGRQMLAGGVTSGTVYLANGSAKAPGAQGKRAGIIEVLSGVGVKVVESSADGEDEALALQYAREGIADVPDLSAVVGVYGYHPAVLAKATAGSGVPVFGYDALPQTLDLIAAGLVQGVVWIREMEFGLHAAAALSDILRLGVRPAMEIRGLNPTTWASNRFVPESAFVTTANVIEVQALYSAARGHQLQALCACGTVQKTKPTKE